MKRAMISMACSPLSHTLVPDYVDCVEIRLMSGTYMITEVHQIRTNVVIRGASGVPVSFNLSDEYLASVNHSSGKPLYVATSDAEYMLSCPPLCSIIVLDSLEWMAFLV